MSVFKKISKIMTGATLESDSSAGVRHLTGRKMTTSRGHLIHFEADNVENGEIVRLAVSVFKKFSKIMTGATLKDRYSEFVTVMTGKIKAQSRAVFISFGAQDVGNVKSARPRGSLCDTFSEVYGLAGATLENRSFQDVEHVLAVSMASTRGFFMEFEGRYAGNRKYVRLQGSIFWIFSKILRGCILIYHVSGHVRGITRKIMMGSRAPFISFEGEEADTAKSSSLCVVRLSVFSMMMIVIMLFC